MNIRKDEEMTEEKKKKQVLVVGDLVTPTGFSTVLHNVIKGMRDDFEITGVGVNYHGDPHDYDFPIFPASRNSKEPYGIERVVNILASRPFDVVFILNDAWVIGYYLDAIKKFLKVKMPAIVVYFPVDAKFHNRQWYKDFDIVRRAYTYTQFGKDEVKKIFPEMKLGIIPHGIDTNDFYKAFQNRGQGKIALFGKEHIEKMGIPADEMFWVLNANRNQPRKKLDITIHGFSLFAKDKPEGVRLYLHSGVTDAHIDLRQIGVRYGVDKRIIVTSLAPGPQRASIPELNAIYNACDVGINTSMGEGWGLTSIEHAVTGAMQIVPRHSACQELFSDCGLLMETVTDYTFDSSNTVGRLVDAQDVARALEVAYRDIGLRDELAEKGMKKFTKPEYQWSNIAGRFRDIFNEVIEEDATPIPDEHTPDN